MVHFILYSQLNGRWWLDNGKISSHGIDFLYTFFYLFIAFIHDFSTLPKFCQLFFFVKIIYSRTAF